MILFPYDEMLPMSNGGKMAAGMPEVTYVFINQGKLSIHMHCP
jgi:hypothetical protein